MCVGRYFPRTHRHVREFRKLITERQSVVESELQAEIEKKSHTTFATKLRLSLNGIIFFVEATSFGFVCVRTNASGQEHLGRTLLDAVWSVYMKQARASAAQMKSEVISYSDASAPSFQRQATIEVFLDALLGFLDRTGKMNRSLYESLQSATFMSYADDKEFLENTSFQSLPILENRIKQAGVNLKEAEAYFSEDLSKSIDLRQRLLATSNQTEFMTYLVDTSYATFKNKYDMHLLQRQLRVARLALWFGIIASFVAVVSLLVSLEVGAFLKSFAPFQEDLTANQSQENRPVIDEKSQNSAHPTVR